MKQEMLKKMQGGVSPQNYVPADSSDNSSAHVFMTKKLAEEFLKASQNASPKSLYKY